MLVIYKESLHDAQSTKCKIWCFILYIMWNHDLVQRTSEGGHECNVGRQKFLGNALHNVFPLSVPLEMFRIVTKYDKKKSIMKMEKN